MIQSFLFQSDRPSNSLGDPCRRVGKLGILIPICIKINLLVLYPLKQEEEEAPQIYCGLIPDIPPSPCSSFPMTSSPCQSLTTGNQIEIDSLKMKVSDLTAEFEMKNIEIANLRKECATKAKEIEAGLDLQTEMKRKMLWGESERRRLHNEVQELKGGNRA